MTQDPAFRFSVAPLMGGTDRHCRYFHRLLTRRARLYTEMIVADAIVRGDFARLLQFDPAEHPVALQIGGSDPEKLARAAQIGERFGYDEINLNIGCPSSRVQGGAFGACLMKRPEHVAECASAIISRVRIPVTVKCRLGVDDQGAAALFEFVDIVAKAGVRVFIIHARKALLQGLSPRENREIPPLDYELAARLKQTRPDLRIVLNGGISTLDAAERWLSKFDGVMLGRAAYGEPFILSDVDRRLFGEKQARQTRESVARAMIPYVRRMAAHGVRPFAITRHMLGLYHGAAGARAWRRSLSESAASADAGSIERALVAVRAQRGAERISA